MKIKNKSIYMLYLGIRFMNIKKIEIYLCVYVCVIKKTYEKKLPKTTKNTIYKIGPYSGS